MINKKYIIDGERRLVATSTMEFVYQPSDNFFDLNCIL